MIFLSTISKDDELLTPRIPSNYFTKNGYEDNKTKRVCFAPSIDKALMALSQKCEGLELYVHEPQDGENLKIKYPTIKEVPDCKITDEIWVLNDVVLKCIGKIKVLRDKGLDGYKFKYGDKEAELYDWEWKWMTKYINEDTLSSKERKELDDSEFGIPELRKYPLVDKDHVLQAIRFFNKVDPKYEKELAKNIIKRMKELKMKKIFVGDGNPFFKYYIKSGLREDATLVNESILLDDKDFTYNLDKWENKEVPILFIGGLMGSGKSTLAKQLANKYNAQYVEMDIISANLKTKYGDRIKSDKAFLSNKYIEYLTDLLKTTGNQLVVEGLHMRFISLDFIVQNAVYIVKTSYLKSFIRTQKRQFEPDYIKRYGFNINPGYFLKGNKKVYVDMQDLEVKLKDISEESSINEFTIKTKIYHASPEANLKSIEPKTAYSYKDLGSVVFGSPNKAFACVFGIGLRDNDLNITTINSKDTDSMIIQLTLKNKNADIHKSFSLYEIENKGFEKLPNKENLKEMTYPGKCKVVKEYKYDDWYEQIKTYSQIKLINFPKPLQEQGILLLESNKTDRTFKCPYCNERFTRVKLIDHIEDEHEDMIPQNYTAARVVFNMINKKEYGTCVQCGKETEWNDNTWRYERYCSEKCLKEYVATAKARMIKTYGKAYLLDEPDHQEKMLKGRGISGEYKFKDGGVRSYCGTFEKKLLEFFDKGLECNSKDIETPGPVIEYEFEGKKHFWITDDYYSPANLVFDVKDGGDNPNTREMPEYRAKQEAKEAAILKQGKYNYIRLTNNNFTQLLYILAEIRERLMDGDDKTQVIHINEFMSTGAINPPIGIDNTSYVVPCMINNTFIDLAYSKDKSYKDMYVVDNGKLKKTTKNELKESYDLGHLYEYTGEDSKNINDMIYKDYTDQIDVIPNYIYNILTNKELLSSDQFFFDDLFKEIQDDFEIGKMRQDIVKESFTHQYNKAIGNTNYFPILDPTLKSIKESILKGYPHLDILQDINGYFIYDTVNENRSSSYDELYNIDINLVGTLHDVSTI